MVGNGRTSVFRDAFGPGFLPGMAKQMKAPVTRAFEHKWTDTGHIDHDRDISALGRVTPQASSERELSL